MMAFLMGLKSVSPADLDALVAAKQVTVLDVNSAGSYAKAHIPGARNLDPEAFGSEDLPADKRSSLVFYCSNPLCRKAPIAAKRAKQMGYEDVKVMSAGINGWISSGLATEAA
ncbi:MAG TPA: rhodanese-like domain-containing protein [Usitatibacter sp.]|jgi:rhodanese-related sulfurtransferase|nr:rhodanese-like domain-containing protein [Usitatibacter sp.]